MLSRDSLFPLIYFLAVIGLLLSSCGEQDNQQPNIIFIFADDQSYNTVRAHGNHEIQTPNIDRLAEQGTSFTHAYNMGGWGGAVCVASRTMLNTGKFVWNAMTVEPDLDSLAAEGLLWSLLMKQGGYETYFSGKWHVKIDPEKIFDHVSNVRPGMPGSIPEAYNRPVEGQKDPWSPFDTSLGGFWKGGRHWSEVLGDDAIDYIQQASGKENPFFMYLAFNAPHDPRQSSEEFVNMYPLENVSVPESFLPEYPYKNEIGCSPSLRDERLAPFPRTEYAVKVHRQEYYAIISHMDSQIGRILDALEESGKAENTYIFFTADHGLSAGHHGLMGKQNMYDHSIRPPMIVVGPGVPAGMKRRQDVYLQDIMPTAIELAGLEIPDYVEFSSLLPTLAGKQDERSYKAIYACYKDRQRMIRKNGYKLIVYPYAARVRLYDLENDPLEMIDISEDLEREELVREMFADLRELGDQLNDTLDLGSFFPGIR
ncbi:MAG TPA: DUF4976 domain-containing protein [Bacteroides sp.]|nr:DUF4976 domain-containing protein [Bacteroides sp.]